MFMKSFMIAAMRGRDSDNGYEQKFEPNRGGYLILSLQFRKTTLLSSISLNLSSGSEPKKKNSEDICTEIRERSFLPGRCRSARME